ncbi:MAG: hypothetical protein ACK5ZC_02985 [Pirellulaceae bacterium]
MQPTTHPVPFPFPLLPLATATRRWLSYLKHSVDGPPSGEGGYGDEVDCFGGPRFRIVHHLAMVATGIAGDSFG